MRLQLTAIIPALLLGCATTPHGEFNGKRASRSEANTFDLVVVFVDGQLVFDTGATPPSVGANLTQWLEPGPHELHVRPYGTDFERTDPLRPLSLNVQACVRYNFIARGTESNWQIVAAGEAPISRCNPVAHK